MPFPGKYEGQRQLIQGRRQAMLTAIDGLWAGHLAAVLELRSGVQWHSNGGRDPLHEYLTPVDRLNRELEEALDAEIRRRSEEARSKGLDPSERGATWTYLTTDRPFGERSELS